MKRLLVPGIPFALSLTLSLCTVGGTVYWQDSGFFLSGVKDPGVLYPPGFVLYLIVCKAWTLLLGFLDFTLAVHLFFGMLWSLLYALVFEPRLRDYPGWLAGTLFAMLPCNVDRELHAMVRSGAVAYELCRPVDLYGLWYARAIAHRTAPTIMRAVPVTVFATVGLPLVGLGE